MKTIVASSRAQAELAADKLGIAHRDWRYCHNESDLRGRSITAVVIALPILDYRDHRRHEIDMAIGYMERRDKAQPRYVRT